MVIMATLKEQLRSDLTASMKAQEVTRRETLRMVLAAVSAEEVAGDVSRELSDEDVVKILAREAKRRRESAEAFRGAGRDELADQEEAELVVIESYLPKQLSDDDVAALVTTALAGLDATGPAAMGPAMKAATAAAAGSVDGKRLSAEVRRQLGMG